MRLRTLDRSWIRNTALLSFPPLLCVCHPGEGAGIYRTAARVKMPVYLPALHSHHPSLRSG